MGRRAAHGCQPRQVVCAPCNMEGLARIRRGRCDDARYLVASCTLASPHHPSGGTLLLGWVLRVGRGAVAAAHSLLCSQGRMRLPPTRPLAESTSTIRWLISPKARKRYTPPFLPASPAAARHAVRMYRWDTAESRSCASGAGHPPRPPHPPRDGQYMTRRKSGQMMDDVRATFIMWEKFIMGSPNHQHSPSRSPRLLSPLSLLYICGTIEAHRT
jgi:hypothetical protein